MSGVVRKSNWRMGAIDPIQRIRIVTITVVLVLWHLLAVSGLFYQGILPPPHSVIKAVFVQLFEAGFYRDLGATALESVSGFVIGAAIAVVVGIFLGANSFFRRAFEPYLLALAATPKIIFLPILFLVFGLGVESKIAKSAISTFFPVVFSAMSGFMGINPVLLKVGDSFNLSLPQKAAMIYIPAMLPPLCVGLRLGIAMSIIGVLSAEIAYSNLGLGYRLITFANKYEIPNMYATVILIFVVVFFVNALFLNVEFAFSKHNKARLSHTAE